MMLSVEKALESVFWVGSGNIYPEEVGLFLAKKISYELVALNRIGEWGERKVAQLEYSLGFTYSFT